MSTVTLSIDTIIVDQRTQQRPLNPDNITKLHELLNEGLASNDPVDVFTDGESYWLAHGHHRYHATVKAEQADITATIHKGDLEDAIDFSCKPLNDAHGQPETASQRQARIRKYIQRHDDHSNRQIAEWCGCSEGTIRNYRKTGAQLYAPESPASPQVGQYPTLSGDEQLASSSNSVSANRSGVGKPTPESLATTQPTRTGRDGKQYPARKPKRKPDRNAIAPDAHRPVRGHGHVPQVTAMNVPHDPANAATSIIRVMGHEFAAALAVELAAQTEDQQ